MTLSEQLLQRSDLVNTQVITRDTGKKLGVINQVWVDVDQREVVALGLKSTLFTGEQRYMYLSSVSQIGDVILVEDERAIEEIESLNYSALVNSEVVTETGELIGKIRGFKFDPNNGQIVDLIIASFGSPWIPSQLISTYELPVDEIVSTGPERLIVFEGAEERLNQLTVGVMERLGIGAPPWEREEEDYLPTTTSTSNQLPSGSRVSYPATSRRSPAVEADWQEPPARRVARQETWEEEQWEEERPVVRQQPQKARRYADYDQSPPEEDNWSAEPAAQNRYRSEARYEQQQYADDLKDDLWEDEEDYKAPQINLPERRKIPEYEQEPEL
uniref:PRC-barrel domain protein n=1 Tax=Cyanothece sp. (strain PCC 7425 / ATCC 29141) TaxID=395961 RepID=B8HYG2_CYAP4